MIAPAPLEVADDEGFQVAAFSTELGWMAAWFLDDELLRLTFGHGNRATAIEALDAGPANRHLSAGACATVARLTRFAAHFDDDLLSVAVNYGSVLTPFRRRVLEACRAIAPGETLSYMQLATLVGAPGAARAVGNVMRTNVLPLVVPCHRVIGSGGSLGGYSAPDGLAMKRRLLEREGALVR